MLIAAAASAAMAAKQASDRNAAQKRTMKANQASEEIASKQRQAEIAKRWAAITGSQEVSAGERGVGAGGSSAAIQTAVLGSALTDTLNERFNLGSRKDALSSAAAAQHANVGLAGISGGFEGLQAAQQIQGAYSDYQKTSTREARLLDEANTDFNARYPDLP